MALGILLVMLAPRLRVINETPFAGHTIGDIAMLNTMIIIPRLTLIQGCLDHQLLSPRGVGISADIPTA
jgi:hypothetical protein